MLQRDLDPTSMAEKPALNPETPRRRLGRPSRKEEVERALAELEVDPALVDPLRVLASIAGDVAAPASARVMACKALLAARDRGAAEDAAGSDVAARAIELMAHARKAH